VNTRGASVADFGRPKMAGKKEAHGGACWLDLFRTFRIASDPVKVWLGFLCTVFTVLTLCLALWLVLGVRAWTGGEMSARALEAIHAGDVGGARLALAHALEKTWADAGSDIAAITTGLCKGGFPAALRDAGTLWKALLWGAVVLLLVRIPVAFFGGAISRAAAVETATGDRLSAREARRFAAGWYGAYYWPPVSLAIVILLLRACQVALGVASHYWLTAIVLLFAAFSGLYVLVATKQRTGSGFAGFVGGLVIFAAGGVVAWGLWDAGPAWVGRIAAALVLPLAVLVGVVVVLLALVLVFGRGLMTSTVSFEATDSFDAVSRAGDYVLKRPWHLVFYSVAGVVYGAVCLAFVALVAKAALLAGLGAVWLGFGSGFDDVHALLFEFGRGEPVSHSVAGYILAAVICGVACVVAGWCVAFVQSFRAVTYALLRRSVDLSDTSEIYLETDRFGPAPEEAPPTEGTEQAES